MYMEVIRFRSTGQSKVTKQHNHLNRKNIKQNKKYKCKYNIKYIYLTFMYCTCKFKMHKKSFFIENYELTFPSKIINNLTRMKSINNISLLKAQISR